MATRLFTFRVLVESTLPPLIRLSGQECVFSQLSADSTKYTKQVKASTLNTQPRVMAFVGFSHNASGAVYPQPTGTVCK